MDERVPKDFRRHAARVGFARVAQDIGVNKTTVYRIVKGEVVPRVTTVERIQTWVEHHGRTD